MSTRRGVHKYNRPPPPTAMASAREALPMDLLLEITARCDVATIIRCARATKFLRRAILDPAFRRRLLALQAAARGGGGGGGSFDPALLIGVSYLANGPHLARAHHVIHTPSSIQLNAGLQGYNQHGSFEPVASSGHLLLLRRFGDSPQPPNVELRVCDTTTGRVTSLPTIAACGAHAFLSVGDADAGGHYELTVMDRRFRFETFSSKRGHWGAVREASSVAAGHHPHRLDASSRVIGRTVYWLCRRDTPGDCSDGILALDVDAAEAMTMGLPPGCSSRMMPRKEDKHLLLASVRGRLSLLVADKGGISMWTSTTAWSTQLTATWSRQLVMGAEEIARPVGLVSSPLSYVLEEFGERSGAVIVRVDRRVLLRLDLGTRVVTRLHNTGRASVSSLFLHETDLPSLLKKSFPSGFR